MLFLVWDWEIKTSIFAKMIFPINYIPDDVVGTFSWMVPIQKQQHKHMPKCNPLFELLLNFTLMWLWGILFSINACKLLSKLRECMVVVLVVSTKSITQMYCHSLDYKVSDSLECLPFNDGWSTEGISTLGGTWAMMFFLH